MQGQLQQPHGRTARWNEIPASQATPRTSYKRCCVASLMPRSLHWYVWYKPSWCIVTPPYGWLSLYCCVSTGIDNVVSGGHLSCPQPRQGAPKHMQQRLPAPPVLSGSETAPRLPSTSFQSRMGTGHCLSLERRPSSKPITGSGPAKGELLRMFLVWVRV